jgi:UDP-N-acetylmuramoylalanine--D-glutamate ligase
VADKKTFEELEPEARDLIKKNPKFSFHLGKEYLDSLNDYDVIIRSPGVSPYFEELEKLSGSVKVTSQTKIFFDVFPGTIVGVTGTKGKSTTSSLIHKILKDSGKEVMLVGNIGSPALDALQSASPNSIAVYELSSHQLIDLDKSPQIAVILNMVAEHLDYYENLNQYFQAKANIAKYQTLNDYLVFNPNHEEPVKIANHSKANKVYVSLEDQKFPGAYLENGSLYLCEDDKKPKKVIGIERVPLLGEFNFLNVLSAIAVCGVLGVSVTDQAKAISRFEPLPHRLERVGIYKGIEFYNDSLSTLPEATMAAIDAFGSRVQTVMLGGYDRNLSYSKLISKIGQSSIETAILFPVSGVRIGKELAKKAPNVKKIMVEDMNEAVKSAYEYTDEGKVCLMSPAAPSFGMFKDYAQRGEEFKRLVRDMGN